MSYKDEYEVARLFTDGGFQRQLHDQFDGELKLVFHMAPPFVSHPRNGQPPRKLSLGAWLLPVLRLLARGKRLRGTAFDLFGHTEERVMERALIAQFELRIEALLPALDAARLPLATAIAQIPQSMRGYGHVKLANIALARLREAELLNRFDPERYPRPTAQSQAGQLRGVAVVRV
jgi:indolepyruvate ferredoxin oxidoreductase